MTAGPHGPGCCTGGTASVTAPMGRGCCRTVSNCGGPTTWCQTTTSMAKAATIVPIYPAKAIIMTKSHAGARAAPGMQTKHLDASSRGSVQRDHSHAVPHNDLVWTFLVCGRLTASNARFGRKMELLRANCAEARE